MILGLWTGGEVTSGIIVSCLPVTPRFFQYLGPKVCNVVSNIISSSSKSRLMTSSGSGSQRLQNQAISIERALDQTEEKEVHLNQAHRKDEYMTLSELDSAHTKTDTTTGWLSTSNGEVLTKQDDLESGRCAR